MASQAGETDAPLNAVDGNRRKRSARACDRCHRYASRCSPGIEGTTCGRCQEQGVPCTYNRPVKRRGPPKRRDRRDAPGHDEFSVNRAPQGAFETNTRSLVQINQDTIMDSPNVSVSSDFYSAYEESISSRTIETILEFFYHDLYPLRPYCHWPSFMMKIRDQQYRNDWGLFIVTMSFCALAAARMSECALLPPNYRALGDMKKISQDCYAAAVGAMPSDITSVPDYYQMMKAKAILASTCLQRGDRRKAFAHLGDYISLSTSSGFHDEANWPENLNKIQEQERRRLFWGAYQQDQYIASNFGFVARQREAKSTVMYPAEVYDDEDITETNIRIRTERVSFLRGWNFCTDLYRLLEHVDATVRAKHGVSHDEPGALVTSFLSRPSKDFASDCARIVAKLHEHLPLELKKIKAMTGDPQTDRYGFIASNVLLTTQTLKMQLTGPEKSSVHQKCAIASELLDELGAIPIAFLQSSSVITLQHLAHVGHLLGDVIQNSLSAWTYLQVRNILLVLAHFLDRLESTRRSSSSLADKLRAHIHRIDQFMQRSSQSQLDPGLLSLGHDVLSAQSNQDSATTSQSLTERETASTHLPDTIPNTMPAMWSAGGLEPGSANGIQKDAAPQAPDSNTLSTFDLFPQGQLPNHTNGSSSLLNFQVPLPPDILDGWPFSLNPMDGFDATGLP